MCSETYVITHSVRSMYVVCTYVCSMWYFAKLITVSTYIDGFPWDLDTMILSLAPDCSRLQFSPNIQSGKYNEMDPILIGTTVSGVSYTDFIVLVPSRQTFVGRERV